MRCLKRLPASTVILVLLAFLATARAETPLGGLLAQEQRFAGVCKRVGIRDSFLAFFDDDVITFGPQMRTGTSHLKSRPADSPSSPLLEWSPSYGDISAAGNLGYTTGASTLTLHPDDPASTQVLHLIYFSIWRKTPTGDWKVIFDAGLSSPSAALPKEFSSMLVQYSAPPTSGQSPRESLEDAENNFDELARTKGLLSALDAFADEQIRVLRDNQLPTIGIERSRALLAQGTGRAGSDLRVAGVASSSDLGYAYGNVDGATTASNSSHVGYFVHVWKYKNNGWRIVLDMLLPLEAS